MDGLKARLSFDAVAYDYDDEYLTIDTDTHTININNVSRLFGVQYDGNSKLIKFRIRNKLSEIQKMQDSIVYINWIDSKGVKGQSIAINKTINNDTCEFAWKVPFDALKNSGVLHFAMSAVVTKNSSSVIDQRWSTQIASVITPDGIYIKSYTPSSEEEDRIAQIYNELSNMINKQNDNLQSQVNSLKEDLTHKINNPIMSDNDKIPRAKDGKVEWVDVGQPTDEQTNSAVTSWLNQHPEATTTVQDRSIEEIKINKNFLPWIKKDYVTPEMFGGIGDGVTDDTDAIQNAISSGHDVFLNSNKIYGIKKKLTITGNGVRFPLVTGGTIKALDNFLDDCILEIKAYEPLKQLKIENITLDGNKLCKFAVKQLYGVNVYYECIKTIGFTSIHFNILDGYETILNHIYCRNNMEYNNESPITGISFGATDSILTDCVTVNFDIGFYTDEEIAFNGCHPWCNNLSFLDTCIGFKVKSQCVFTNCSFDTLKYGLYVIDYYTQYLNGCRFIHTKDTEHTYIYLSYGVDVYVYGSKITQYTGMDTITNKPESVYLYTCDIKGTYTNKYNNKKMFLNADKRYQLKFHQGYTLKLNAGDSITKIFDISGVKEFDILIVTPVYATDSYVYKAVPKLNKIEVTITNPTQSTLSIANYIYFNVVHITGNGNKPFTWTEVEASAT